MRFSILYSNKVNFFSFKVTFSLEKVRGIVQTEKLKRKI